MTALRMLALSPVPEDGAGCRFRIAQYMPALAAAGIHATISPFFTPEFFRLVYQNGHAMRKSALFLERAFDRLRMVMARERYDVIFIYREAFPIGPALIESMLSRTPGVAVIYDFDDAVYLPNTSDANRPIGWLKWPGKVKTIIGHSDRVIAGNEYLAAYARQFADDVRVIPTCVDTTTFVPRSDAPVSAVPVVGWIGTPTTVPYLRALQPVLQEVARAHPFVLRVCGAGSPLQMPGVTVDNVPWRLDAEVALFNTCDVGVYPLSDDEWARGKCGFKAIQFMACGVPVVAAPVGVNRDIIEDGVSGLLAADAAEWVEKLGRLLAGPALRARLGMAGRETIESRYSLKTQAPGMVDAVAGAVARPRAKAGKPATAREGVNR